MSGGLGGAPGVLLAGLQSQDLQLLGVTVLAVPVVSAAHTLTNPGSGANTGTWSLPLSLPTATNLLNTDFYFQSLYLDPFRPQGLSATAGMKLRVR